MRSGCIVAAALVLGACDRSSGEILELTPEGDIPLTSGAPVRQVERPRVVVPRVPPPPEPGEIVIVQPGAVPPPAPVESDDEDADADDSDSVQTADTSSVRGASW